MNTNDAKKQPSRRLGDFLCFSIYSANLAFGRAYRPILEKLGLTYPQYVSIVALWEEDNQTVGRLGDKLFLESNTLTPMLKKLEAMGYIRRQRDPADERQVVVSLTDAGWALRDKISSAGLVKACGLSPEEFASLRQNIVAVRDKMIAAAEN